MLATLYRLRRGSIFLCLLTLFGGTCLAQRPEWLSEYIKFQHLTVTDGLSQNSTNAIVQDNHGFMWIGTQDGLNRYDGRRFEYFRPDPQDPTTISGRTINTLMEDMVGDIWVGLQGSGLCYYHRRTGKFTRFEDRSLSSPIVLDLLEQDGYIWVATENGLNRVHKSTKEIEWYLATGGSADLPNHKVNALVAGKPKMIWIGTSAGLAYKAGGDGPIIPIDDDGEVLSLNMISDQELLVGTRQGVRVLSLESKTFEPEYLVRTQAPVTSLVEDVQGILWLGTPRGLLRYDPRRDLLRSYVHDLADPQSLGGNIVREVYEDRTDNLWIGTEASGISRYNRADLTITHLYAPRSKVMGSNVITNFFEDDDQGLWFGTDGGGLHRLDLQSGEMKRWTKDPDDPNSLCDDYVWNINEDANGMLWITTRNGLNRFDRRRDQWRHYNHDPDDPNSLANQTIFSSIIDHRQRVWMATSHGLSMLDPKTERFTNYFYQPGVPNALSSNLLLTVFEDSQQRLWVGTYGTGLNLLREERGDFLIYKFDPDDPHSLGQDTIIHMFEDSRKRIWVGTDGGISLMEKPGKFRRFTTKDGLPDDIVYSFTEDSEGYLWLGTNHGISRFDTDKLTFKNFGLHHNLQSYEFNQASAITCSNGMVVMGGVSGINIIDPKHAHFSAPVPNPMITGFLKFNDRVELDWRLEYTDEIQLTWKDRVVSFEFAALDFHLPEGNRFAYELEGITDGPIYLGTKNHISFTNLDPGSYTLRLRVGNADGVWNDITDEIQLTMVPPPWRSTPAYLLYAVLAVLLLWAIHWLQRIRERHLEEKVAERTRELNDRTQELETFYSINQTINREISLDKVLPVIMEQAIRLFPQAESGSFLQMDANRQYFRVVAVIGYDSKLAEQVRMTEEQTRVRYVENAEELEQGIYIVRDPDEATRPESVKSLARPRALLVMAVHLDQRLEGYMVLDHSRSTRGFTEADVLRLQRFREQAISALVRAKVLKDLAESQNDLVEAAHMFGMAENATMVLHNIGNKLNSVNTSIQVIRNKMEKSKWSELVERLRHKLLEDGVDERNRESFIASVIAMCERITSWKRELGRETQRVEDMVQAVLDGLRAQWAYTRVNAGLEPADPLQLIRGCLRMEGLNFESKGVVLCEDYGRLPLVLVQKIKFIRVLFCVLENALEAALSLHGKRGGRVKIAAHEREGKVHIEVHDNGVGVSEANLGRIFQEGFTTKTNSVVRYGLHNCANAMSEMHGEIHMHSDGPGEGSVFTLVLPVSGGA